MIAVRAAFWVAQPVRPLAREIPTIHSKLLSRACGRNLFHLLLRRSQGNQYDSNNSKQKDTNQFPALDQMPMLL